MLFLGIRKSPKVEYENWLLERYKDLHKQLLVIAVDSKGKSNKGINCNYQILLFLW